MTCIHDDRDALRRQPPRRPRETWHPREGAIHTQSMNGASGRIKEIAMIARYPKLAGFAIILGLAMGLSGCIEDDRSFFIRQNQVPQTGCVVNTTTTEYLPRGTLDVSMGIGYRLYPLLENNLKTSKTTDGEPERNSLHITGFEVDIDLGEIPGEFPSDLTSFWEPASGQLDPGGKLASVANVISDRLTKMLNIPKGIKPLVLISIKAVAKRSGSDKDSSTFVFPIDLCNGCLVDWRTTCPATTDKTVKKNYCGRPQDQPVTCCTDPATGTKCIQSTGS